MPKRKNTEESTGAARRRVDDEHHAEEHEHEEKPTLGRGGRKRTKTYADDEEDEFFTNIAREVDEGGDTESPPEGGLTTRTNLEAGQIRRIYVENFMCHRKFSIDLGEGLNFITGKNGSGKSAVAAAIQLCLGATARNTGRGSNLSTLIREGADNPAVIRVTMVNTGPDAYKPEEYGNTITVERRIMKGTGVSGYTLRDQHGKVVSDKRSELENILRAFSIFVDNPCCILTQDESKRFINGKADQKYDFVLKATGLYALREELQEIRVNAKAAKTTLEQNEERLQHKLSHVEALKTKYEQLKRLDTLEDDIKLYQAKVQWAELGVRRGKASTSQLEFDKIDKAVKQLKEDFEGAHGHQGNYAEELDAAGLEVDAVTQKLEEVNARLEEKGEAAHQASRAVTKHNQLVQALQKTLTENRKRLKNVETEIQEMQEKALQGAKAEEKVFMTDIARITRELETKKVEQNSLQDEKNNVVQAIQRLRNEKANLMREEQAIRGDIDRLRNEHRNLQSNSANGRVAVFGNDILGLFQAMERERFRAEVVGPIGSMVTIKDQYSAHWGVALERALGPYLRAFVVTCVEDRERLQTLAAQRNVRGVQIITQSAHSRYIVNTAEIPEDVLTVFECLTVPNDTVLNALVDQLNIDKTALVETHQDVERRLVQGTSGHQSMKYGLSSALDRKGNMVSYRSGSQGNESNRFPFRNVLAKDATETIRSLEANIAQKEDELRELQSRHAPMTTQMRDLEDRLNHIDGQLSGFQKQFAVLNRDKRAAENKLQEVQEAGRIDTTALEQERTELQDAIAMDENKLEVASSNLTGSKDNLKACQEEKAVVDRERHELTQELHELDKRIEAIVKQRQIYETKHNTFKKRIEEKEKALTAARDKLEAAMYEVKRQEEQAIEETKQLVRDWDEEELVLKGREQDVAYLEKKIKETRAELNENKKAAGLAGESLEQVQGRYERAQKDYDLACSVVERVRNNLGELSADESIRVTKWKRALSTSSKKVKRMFDRYVQSKGAAGTINFNHKEELLDVTYQVDNTDEASVRNDVRNLSGGERSFVTFSLLLALGHVIESPFRLMDEYDVFMDEPTRKLTLDILKTYIKQPDQCNRQFIILSPHTLGDTMATPTLHIKKMPEPIRNSASGLQQQTID